jgi:hypothetical protein
MTKGKRLVAAALLLPAALAVYGIFQRLHPAPVTAEPVAGSTKVVETTNYAITSTATEPQTKLVADAVESLHARYLAFFANAIRIAPNRKRLLLTLYKDQDEFKEHNKGSSWAEAYYLPPVCHAYFAGGEGNPYHWMVHEATHQLNHEVAHLPRSTWIGEGLATYFGTSLIRDGNLIPGKLDVDTYPIWWLSKLSLSGDLQRDIRSGKIIDLRALISGVGGPSADEKVNARYIGYWSLTHFLFHFENGRYADRYRQLITVGGSIEQFERTFGPIDRIQGEWYAYLRGQVALTKIEKIAKGVASGMR